MSHSASLKNRHMSPVRDDKGKVVYRFAKNSCVYYCGSGIESRWGGRDFRTRPDRPWGSPTAGLRRIPVCTTAVRRSNPGGGGEIFASGPGAHPTSCTVGTGFFPGVKQQGRCVNHPPHLAPRLKKEYSSTSVHPLGLRGLF